MKQRNSGLSLVLVMAALVVTGFVGAALLKLSQTDRIGAILYSSSESARSAARSGIISALTRIGTADVDSQAVILDILNTYMEADIPDTLSDPQYLWIKGGPSSWQTISSNQKFRVKLTAFHPLSHEVTLVSDGLGAGNSKATAVATYKLKNLGLTSTTTTKPRNAIQMDNGAFEFNVNLEVNGNTNVKKGMTVNDGYAIFNGTFRQDTLINGANKYIETIVFNTKPAYFNGPTYFAGGGYFGAISAANGTRFNASVGFENRIIFSQYTQFNGDTLILNAGAGNMQYASHSMNSNTLMGYSGGTWTRTASEYYVGEHCGISGVFNSYSGGSIAAKADIRSLLGFPEEPDPAVYFDTTKLGTPHRYINASAINTGNRITSTTLNSWYSADSTAGNLLGGTFMVVRVTGNCGANGIFANNGTPFKGKAIVWVDDGKNVKGDMIETSSSANFSMYIKNSATTDPYFGSSQYLRGFIYVHNSPSTDFVFQANNISHLVGSVYGSSNARFKFDGGPGATRRITYDSDVIDELDLLGIFTDPSNTTSQELIITGDRIGAEILSQAL